MFKKIQVLTRELRITDVNEQDYVSLTGIARCKNPDASDDLIRNWLRNRNTLESLGLWVQINNPGFNSVEFDGIRKQPGRYGGTYAHLEIALEFASLEALKKSLLHQAFAGEL